MKNLILALGLLSLTTVSFAGVCKHSLLHTIVPTGSQTIVFGCDSQNIPYKSLLITYYRQADMLKSVRVLVDSRETSDRKRAELAIGLISVGEQSKEVSRAIRQNVMSELKLALDSSTEEERNDHLNTGAENLKKILTE